MHENEDGSPMTTVGDDGGGVACRFAFAAGHRSFAEPLSLYLRRTLWLVSMFIVWDVIDRLS